ncbi:hypothetical protein M3661_01220 [Paenibacillus sp. MER 180]|uniref:hypothetical protein n=1 Tax=unclassified Paenibacillus TaxID=185978 RepID=UPI0008065B28|nr:MULTISPECIES: hypothetical protein [unclassified Paenibacillus]MCM3288752.1 hypothetical protein [Paenibacillus sp. MER 180]OBY79879.1 hypothetical protein BBG47_09000 [Paenibacillus sp. KS1]
MNDRILVELNDLRQAHKQIGQLAELLERNEQYVQQQLARLQDWVGISADEMKQRLSKFQSELVMRRRLLTERQQELLRYIRDMERADQSAASVRWM